MHPKSLALINNALGICAKYEELVAKIQTIDTAELLDNEWEAEDRKLMESLGNGRIVGVQKCQVILGTKSKSKSKPKDKDAAEEPNDLDRAAVEACFFPQKEVLAEGVTGAWGEVAKKQEKAVRKLVNASFAILV